MRKRKRKRMTRPADKGRRDRAVRLSHPDGRAVISHVSANQARRLQKQFEGEGPFPVAVNAKGRITRILSKRTRSLASLRERFQIHVDPPHFDPYISDHWQRLIRTWSRLEPGRSRRVLLYGPEGCGKDTLSKCLIQEVNVAHGAENVDILGFPSEEDDRYVRHMETKADMLADAVETCKRAGNVVIAYFPEIASIFGSGDYCGAWQNQFQAFFRNLLDGTRDFQADLVLAHTNTLAGLGGPTVSRFHVEPIKMTPETARGMLAAHWPVEVLNGQSSDYVLRRLTREVIAEATLANSRKRLALKADALTGYNGRFIADLCQEVRDRLRECRETDPNFVPDAPFLDGIVRERLAAIVDPVREAAGTRAIRDLLVIPVDLGDAPISVMPKLDWCEESACVAD